VRAADDQVGEYADERHHDHQDKPTHLGSGTALMAPEDAQDGPGRSTAVDGESGASQGTPWRLQDPLVRGSVCTAGQPACPQVGRCNGWAGSDRETSILTGPWSVSLDHLRFDRCRCIRGT
jgi:hypothetical protein